jgi:membrane fusion protein, heavy metal efflux system
MFIVFLRKGAGLALALAVGLMVGWLLPTVALQMGMTPWFFPEPHQWAGTELHPHPHDHEDDEYDHIDVSRQARASLGLRRASVWPDTYTSWMYVPGAVVERPGISDLHIVTRFEGIVEEILAVPGQAVREGDSLFQLRLTGDELAAAQASLLDAVQQVVILDQEIERLRSAVQQGGLAGRSLLELEYERKRMLARKGTKRQELMIRGLDQQQIAQITDTQEMVRTVAVRLPLDLVRQLGPHATYPAEDGIFTIEALAVTPGSYVRPGDALANLANHARLYLEGYAFERDIEVIAAAIAEDRSVVAELGDAQNPTQIDGLRIVHLDNHVDTATQTYRFYIELENEVLQDSLRGDGRRFRTWRYKPGQRGHIGLPGETYHGVFVLPTAAVVQDGLEHVVFRRTPTPIRQLADLRVRDDTPGNVELPDDDGEEEYVPVPIRMLHRDRHVVVASASELLQAGDVIAMNSAYQLWLAMRSGGEHDDHHHDH